MSEANPVDRKQFPLGRLLFTGGLTALVVVIAFSFHRLFEGSRATFGAIDNPTATPIALPGPGEYILTRAEGISDDRSITATINTPTTPPASLEFISNDGTGYFTVDSQTNQILCGFIAPHAGAQFADIAFINANQDFKRHARVSSGGWSMEWASGVTRALPL